MDDKFCIAPFLILATQNKGQIRNCCKSTPRLEEHSKYTKGFYKDSFWNVWNNPYIMKTRMDLTNGTYVPACKRCYDEENANGRSKRISENEKYPYEKYKHVVDNAIKENGKVDHFPISYDLHFGNICNLKCRTCWIGASNQLAKDVFKLVEKGEKLTDYLQMEYDGHDELKFRWIEQNPELINLIKQNYSVIEHMEISGGEPTILKEFFEIIEYFVEHDHAKNVTLRINTNLTNVKEHFLNLISRFKEVALLGSIDGYDKQNDFLRVPSRWQTISNNAIKLNQTFKNHNAVKFALNTAVSNQNIGYLPELLDWCSTNNLHIHLDPVHEPVYFKPRIMPNELKQEITNKLSTYIKTYTYNDTIKHRLQQMVNLMNETDSEHDKLYKDFKVYMKQLDNLRSNNFGTVFPMWEKYYV